MIIKFLDVYLNSKLTPEILRGFIQKTLEEHVKEISDFDLEHFIEALEDSENFELIQNPKDVDLEYTQDDVDMMVDKILEEDYEDYYDDELRSEDDEYDIINYDEEEADE